MLVFFFFVNIITEAISIFSKSYQEKIFISQQYVNFREPLLKLVYLIDLFKQKRWNSKINKLEQ